jgi:hypothetical protein
MMRVFDVKCCCTAICNYHCLRLVRVPSGEALADHPDMKAVHSVASMKSLLGRMGAQ